ncbi:uncharacterized protein VTP21DRAFT_4008 [Calcarisporiella thermophila]|uniref:uncharacterized protein n=1 Tax=Calcarisporiella thermophila TaxID=911321 RepID=UPI003744AF2A
MTKVILSTLCVAFFLALAHVSSASPVPAEQLENSAEIDKRFIGWGFPTVLNSAYYANSANVKDRFHHHANLAANVKANEATKAANHADVYNVANTNAVVHKRQVAGLGALPLGLGGIAGGLPLAGISPLAGVSPLAGISPLAGVSPLAGISPLAGVSPLAGISPLTAGLPYATGLQYASGIPLASSLQYTTGLGAIGTPYI